MNERTIKEPTLNETKILSSRFIAILSPCENEEAFASLLAKARKDYPKATHYCYAYRLRKEEGFSDDGEPSRSVGLPLLTYLRNIGLRRVALIAVRYFGGTKLGLPRLKRVYLETAIGAVAKAPLYEVVPAVKLWLESDYSSYERIKSEALLRGYSLGEETFSSSVRFSLLADATLIKAVEEALPPSIHLFGREDDVEILRSPITHDPQ